MAVKITINEAELRELLTSPTGPVGNYLADAGRQIENAAKIRCPVDEGRLKTSITSEITTSLSGGTVAVFSDLEYALFVHEGTGIYGPFRRPIRPTNHRFLKFRPGKGAPFGSVSRDGFVYARQVRGSRPRPFLVDALRDIAPTGSVTVNPL